MKCEDLAEQLTDLLEGTMEPAVQQAALAHLGSCPDCEQVMSETQETIALVQDHGRIRLEHDTKTALLSSIIDTIERTNTT